MPASAASTRTRILTAATDLFGVRGVDAGIEGGGARHPRSEARGHLVVRHARRPQHEACDLLVGAAGRAHRDHVLHARGDPPDVRHGAHEGLDVRAGGAEEQRAVDVEEHQHPRG